MNFYFNINYDYILLLIKININYKKKDLPPFTIFPEGTTTNGTRLSKYLSI